MTKQEVEDFKMAEIKKLLDNVRLTASDFIGDDMPVSVNYDKVELLAEDMKSDGKLYFDIDKDLNHAQTILVELMANSINYCFWYGKYSFKPVGSTDLYEVVIDAVKNKFEGVVSPNFVNSIIDRLTFDRYPLLEDRVRHLLEVSIGTQDFLMYVVMNKQNAPLVLYELVRRYPGFASDMFLKRAFLFITCLNRKLGYFENSIQDIPVPADYQVPKMLRHYGCLSYSDKLAHKIDNHTILPRTSLEEISIRAGTVTACDKLAELTSWKMADIDSWLWLRRKECDEPFHLTITTDY